MRFFLRFADKVSEYSAKVCAWLIIPLVFALFYESIARYLFNAPSIWAYDISYMLYATIFLMGAGYVHARDKHVKVDVLSRYFSSRAKAIIDLCLYLLLFFPAIGVLVVIGVKNAYFSWLIREVSASGLWRPPLYPLRSILPISMAVLLLQGVAQFIRSIYIIVGKGEKDGI
jgi:TRAP-type mannitol/chloroaromatic compound transport system permease small subunit